MYFDRKIFLVVFAGFLLGGLLFAALFIYTNGTFFGYGLKRSSVLPGCTIFDSIFEETGCYAHVSTDGSLNLTLSADIRPDVILTVSGITCTKSNPPVTANNTFFHPVELRIGQRKNVTGGETGNIVFCTDPAEHADYYLGNLFIYYTLSNESGMKTANSHFITPFNHFTSQPTQSGWLTSDTE